jgi:hypothetical protein
MEPEGEQFAFSFPCYAVVSDETADIATNVTFETGNREVALAIFTDQSLADDFRIEVQITGVVRELGARELLDLLQAQEDDVTLVGMDPNPKTQLATLIAIDHVIDLIDQFLEASESAENRQGE